MEGKFSGRLPTKEDERKLADECQLMAPLLSENGSLCTLPTIIRAMATGRIRLHLEKQRDGLSSLKPPSAPQSIKVQLPTANGLKQIQVAQMPVTDVSNPIVAQLADGITQSMKISTVPPTTTPASAGNEHPAQTAAATATTLNDHADQLEVAAKVHEAANAVASMQAQQLAAQAQQHAQAAVQAAHQAEELKKTLSALPDTQQTRQAADIIQVHQVVTQALTTSGQEGRGTPFRGAAAAASATTVGRFSGEINMQQTLGLGTLRGIPMSTIQKMSTTLLRPHEVITPEGREGKLGPASSHQNNREPRSVGPGNCRVNGGCTRDCCHHTVKPMLKDPLPPKLKKSTKPASPPRDGQEQPPEDLMLDNVLRALYNHHELDQDLVHRYVPVFFKLSGKLRMTIGKQLLAFAAEPSGRSLHSFLAGVVAWHQ